MTVLDQILGVSKQLTPEQKEFNRREQINLQERKQSMIDNGIDVNEANRLLGLPQEQIPRQEGLIPDRFNPLQQAKALPQFLQQLVNPPQPQDLGVARTIKEEKPETKSTFTPQQEADMKRFGTKDEMISLGKNNEGDEFFRDPFGGTIIVKKDGVANRYLWDESKALENQEIIDKFLFKGPSEDSRRKKVLNEIKGRNADLSGNGFNIYKLPSGDKVRSVQDLFDEENAKRAAFNLDQLTSVPDWIKEEAKKPRKGENFILVIENISTGDINAMSTTENSFVESSADIFSISMQLKERGEFGKPTTGSASEGLTERHLLNSDLTRSAPKEIKDRLFRQTPFSESGESVFAPMFIPNEDFMPLDSSVVDFFKEEDVNANITKVNIPQRKGADKLQRLNPIAQAGALVQILSGRKFEQDLGVKTDLPVGEELRKVNEKIKRDVEPAVVRVGMGLAEDQVPEERRKLIVDENNKLSIETEKDTDAAGSGFHIGNGLIVTSRHVVVGKDGIRENINVTAKSRKRGDASIVYIDPEQDWAILKIEGFDRLKSIPLGTAEKPEDERRFAAITGFPGGEFPFKTQRGILGRTGKDIFQGQSFQGMETFPELQEITSAIFRGQSGGAVVDQFGNVIGINSRGVDDPEIQGEQGAFVPIDIVKERLKELGIIQ